MKRPPVVLLHGLARAPRSMRRLEHAIAGEGVAVHNWGYPSRRHPVSILIETVRKRLQALASEHGIEEIDCVGHSLGGLLLRGALDAGAPPRARRIVMIGTPNHGARLINPFRRLDWLAPLYGLPTRELWRGAPLFADLPVPAAEIGIIAGTRRWHWANPNSYLNALIDNPASHDGTVEVDSTRLAAAADFIAIDATHTWLPCDRRVVMQTARFLREGRFAHEPDQSA